MSLLVESRTDAFNSNDDPCGSLVQAAAHNLHSNNVLSPVLRSAVNGEE